MNIRNILHTERDKMQATVRHLQHVLNSLDKLIEQWDTMVPPGSERSASATDVPIPEVAGIVGPDKSPLVIHIPMKDAASAEPHQPAQDRAAAPPRAHTTGATQSAQGLARCRRGEMTHAQLCERWGCKPKRVLNLKYAGRLRGRPGMVTIESLEAYERKSAQPLVVRHAATLSAAGMPVAEAAALLGVSTTRISQLVREGTLQRVRRGLVSPESVEQLRGKKTAPPAVPEAGQKSPPKPVDEPVSRTRGSDTDEPYRPESMPTDQYASMEKAADNLGISVEQVREMKAASRSAGAPGMVNLSSLLRFMAHPQFDELMSAHAE